MNWKYSAVKSNVVPCRNCGAMIGFHKLRDGALMPVDVTEKGNYRTGMGNHRNFTPRHRCLQDDQKLARQSRINFLKLSISQVEALITPTANDDIVRIAKQIIQQHITELNAIEQMFPEAPEDK